MINGPDGLTGAIMAIESIPGATVLLHGPGGCRIRNSLLSMALVPREDRVWGAYREPFYAGYSRVPASYIDGEDFVGGAVHRLEEALEVVRREGAELIAIIDSPGASLMADDHRRARSDLGMDDDVIVMGGQTMSAPMRRTYGRTLGEVLRRLSPGRGLVRKGTVCIIGLTVLDPCWEDVLEEFSAYLGDMGLEVLCSPGAGASVSDLRRSVEAEYCVTVCPESSDGVSGFYRDAGVEVVCPDDAPVGFDSTRRWILDVAKATGRDPSVALERLGRREGRVRRKADGMRYGMMRIEGMTFSACAPPSVLRPLASWLGGLGMVPVSLIEEDANPSRMVPADIVFCDGNTALRMDSGRRCRASVSTGGAVLGSDGFVTRTIYGSAGAEHILDTVLRASRGR